MHKGVKRKGVLHLLCPRRRSRSCARSAGPEKITNSKGERGGHRERGGGSLFASMEEGASGFREGVKDLFKRKKKTPQKEGAAGLGEKKDAYLFASRGSKRSTQQRRNPPRRHQFQRK